MKLPVFLGITLSEEVTLPLSLKNAIVLSKAASQPFSSILFHIFDVDFITFIEKWISLLS